jgi:hypothetical protein
MLWTTTPGEVLPRLADILPMGHAAALVPLPLLRLFPLADTRAAVLVLTAALAAHVDTTELIALVLLVFLGSGLRAWEQAETEGRHAQA